MKTERRNDPVICDRVAVKLGFKNYKQMQRYAESFVDEEKAEELGNLFKQEYAKINPNYTRPAYKYL